MPSRIIIIILKLNESISVQIRVYCKKCMLNVNASLDGKMFLKLSEYKTFFVNISYKLKINESKYLNINFIFS